MFWYRDRMKSLFLIKATASLLGNLAFSTRFTFLELLFKISSLRPLGFSSIRVVMDDQRRDLTDPSSAVVSDSSLINVTLALKHKQQRTFFGQRTKFRSF